MFSFDKNLLRKISYFYLMLPLLVFICGFIKPLIALPMAAILIFAYYSACIKGSRKIQGFNITNNRLFLYILYVISLIWCWFAGIGYMYYQSNDHHWRNAIFRDLINYHWPVIYENTHAALIYYIGHWLPTAALSKIFLLIHIPNENAFILGNVLLLFYSAFGVLLVILNILEYLKVYEYKKIFIAFIMLIFFSGMDILGRNLIFGLHLEWWSGNWQYSSNSTVLFWVFNQGIPAWLATALFLNEEDIKNYGFIAANTFFCAPFPFIGLSIFMLAYAIKDFINAIKENIFFNFLKNKIFTVQNCVSIFILLPVIFFYFQVNSKASAAGNTSLIASYNIYQYALLGKFLLYEFLIFALLIFNYYKKSLLFYISTATLLIIPFINFISGDFYMRASIPALFVLMVLITNYLFNAKKMPVLLIICLAIGMVTPLAEFYRGIHYIYKLQRIDLVADDIKTFNRNDLALDNFTSENYKNSVFFKYLAK